LTPRIIRGMMFMVGCFLMLEDEIMMDKKEIEKLLAEVRADADLDDVEKGGMIYLWELKLEKNILTQIQSSDEYKANVEVLEYLKKERLSYLNCCGVSDNV